MSKTKEEKAIYKISSQKFLAMNMCHDEVISRLDAKELIYASDMMSKYTSQLFDELAELKEQLRWRSVEEEMPALSEVKELNKYLIRGYFQRGELRKEHTTLQSVNYHDSLHFGIFIFDLPSEFTAIEWLPIPRKE